MKKILSVFLLVIFVFSFSVMVFAGESDGIYDFHFTKDDITFKDDGYENYIVYEYNGRWYVCYFNESDLESVLPSDGDMQLTFTSSCTYYRIKEYFTSAHWLFYRYGGVADVTNLYDSKYPKTSLTFTLDLATDYVMTNSETVLSICSENNIVVYDDYYVFYNNTNEKEYSIYSISVSENQYVLTISTDKLVYTASTATLKPSANRMYNFYFNSEVEAVSFALYGYDSVLQKITASTSISNVDTILYASESIYDSGGNLIFEAKPIVSSDNEPGGGGGSFDDTNILEKLKNIIDSIKNLPETITNAFETAKNATIEKMQEAIGFITEKFDFVKNLFMFTDRLVELFKADHSTPPAIYADLSAAESEFGYIYGYERVRVIDFSWYQPYKPIGDVILSSFLWLGFLWRLFKYIPSLMGGTSMITDHLSAEKREVDTRSRQEAERRYKESYDYYEKNRERRELYDATYNYKHHEGGG